MRAVIQRVLRGRVTVKGEEAGAIGPGLVILLGVEAGDDREGAAYLAEKVANLRIFADSRGKMDLSLGDTRGGALVVSQFTLCGDCRKGRRPSFSQAADPGLARDLYEEFCRLLGEKGINVATGRFQEMMVVEIINDGPVTFLLDSRRQF